MAASAVDMMANDTMTVAMRMPRFSPSEPESQPSRLRSQLNTAALAELRREPTINETPKISAASRSPGLQDDVAAPVRRKAEDVPGRSPRERHPADGRPDDGSEGDQARDAEDIGRARGDVLHLFRREDAPLGEDQVGDVPVDHVDQTVDGFLAAAEPEPGDGEGEVDRREDREERLIAHARSEQEPVALQEVSPDADGKQAESALRECGRALDGRIEATGLGRGAIGFRHVPTLSKAARWRDQPGT